MWGTLAQIGFAAAGALAIAGPVYAQSPVRPGAIVHRSEFTSAEWDVLQNRHALIIGLSNHGYDFPGSIDTFRAANTTTPVLSYVELSAIQQGNVDDDRFDQYDVAEEVFFHTTDPASFRALALEGTVALAWMRDARDQPAEHYTPPGVTEYLVETAPAENGPWTEAVPPVAGGATLFPTAFVEGGSSTAWYRVRSRLGDGTVVGYSWPMQPQASGSAIMSGSLGGGSFTVVVAGPWQPANVADVVIEIDRDRDRVWGESGERVPATSRVAESPGSWRYSGPVTLGVGPVHYRFVIDGLPGATAPPPGESYTLSRRNNRLGTSFSSLLTKPAHPLTRTIHLQRLEDALAAGYDGVHFDFAYDDFSPSWITAGDVAPREQVEAGALADGVSDLLGALQVAQPDATIVFNGFFVVENEISFDAYLANASGGTYEFFAFGFDAGATEIHPWTGAAFDGILRASHLDEKISVAVVSADSNNVDARLKSLAIYLLVAHERVHYVYASGTQQDTVEWYPEWDVPLGAPTQATLTGYDDLAHPQSSSLAHRAFANGEVFFNWHQTEPIVLDLPTTYYRLDVTGGLDPALGGDGAATYVPVDQITIMPRDGAILVIDPAGGLVGGGAVRGTSSIKGTPWAGPRRP